MASGEIERTAMFCVILDRMTAMTLQTRLAKQRGNAW
jgi:hypothetical protein